MRITFRLCLLALLAACGKPAVLTPPIYAPLPAPDADTESAPRDRLPVDTHPLRYGLTLEIEPEKPTFRGEVRIDLALDRPRESLYLHAKDLRASAVRVVRVGAEPLLGKLETLSDTGLSAVRLPQPVGPGVVRLEIEYEASFSAELNGLYRVKVDDVYYAFTQFEAMSARQAFPCFDEPRFKTPFELTLRVPARDVAIANTRESPGQPLANGLKEVHFAVTEKLPTYLVAAAVGPFDVVPSSIGKNDVRQRELPLRGVAVQGRGGELAYALRETPRILASLERYFGTEYPYDKLDLIAVPDFGAGAMENAGAVTFRDTILLLGADAPEGQRRGFAYVNAHELAHQWFGNLVTMPWWDDLWLNESFATWMGTRVVEEIYPDYDSQLGSVAYAHYAMNIDSRASARQIRQPIESDHDVANAFDGITYSKGGAVLRMFERYLGEETFQKGLRSYMARHRFGNATARDLTDALSEAAGDARVSDAFFSFLEQPGVPLVRVACDAAGRAIRLTQSRYRPLGATFETQVHWQVPTCMRIKAGADLREVCTLLTEPASSVPLDVASCPEWGMPNADAAGYYRWSLPSEQFTRLAAARAELRPSELIALVDSASAAMRAGELDADRLLEILFTLSDSPSRHVLEALLGPVAFVRDSLLDEPSRALLRAKLGRVFAPLYARYGLFPKADESKVGDLKLTRALVVHAMALAARDPRALATLAGLGEAELGLREDARIEALPSELIDHALEAAVLEGGERVLTRAIEELTTTEDGIMREHILSALGGQRDPALAERVLALALDERLRLNERLQPVNAQMSNLETRAVAYAWVKAHFADLRAKARLESAKAIFSPMKSFCSAAEADDVASFFAPHVNELRGGPRELELTLESIRSCAAIQEAQGEKARAYFGRPRAGH